MVQKQLMVIIVLLSFNKKNILSNLQNNNYFE